MGVAILNSQPREKTMYSRGDVFSISMRIAAVLCDCSERHTRCFRRSLERHEPVLFAGSHPSGQRVGNFLEANEIVSSGWPVGANRYGCMKAMYEDFANLVSRRHRAAGFGQVAAFPPGGDRGVRSPPFVPCFDATSRSKPRGKSTGKTSSFKVGSRNLLHPLDGKGYSAGRLVTRPAPRRRGQ